VERAFLIGALIALERGGGGSIAKPLTTKGTKVHEGNARE
jgi:hypothetical protein